MKKIKLLILFIVITVFLFGTYIYKYQQIVNEGSYLADEHCIKVNPLVISRKNEYINQIQLMQASASAQEVQDSISNYLEISNSYLTQEKIWLEKQKRFLSKWEFNLLMPQYIKEGANSQYSMYEADFLSSTYLTQAFFERDESKQMELSNKVLEETAKSKAAGDKYNAIWESEKGKTDWRYRFVRVLESKCPRENEDIPDVQNPFLPKSPPRSPLS